MILGLTHASAQTNSSSTSFPTLFEKSQVLKLAAPVQILVTEVNQYASPSAFVENPAVAWQEFNNNGIPAGINKEVWIKLQLPAYTSALDPNLWHLRLPKVNVESISVFTPGSLKNTWIGKSAGSLHERSTWPLNTRDPIFELSLLAEPRTVYVRVINRTALNEQLQLIAASDTVQGANRVGTLNGLLIGLFSALMLVSLMSMQLNRNAHFGWFALFVLATLLSQLSLTGYLSQRIWPSFLNWARMSFWIMPLLSLPAFARFAVSISYAKDVSKAVYYVFYSVITLSLIVCAAILAFDPYFLWHWLEVIYALISSINLLALAWLAWRFQPRLWPIVLAILPLSLFVFARLAYNLGWIEHIEIWYLFSAIVASLGLMVIYTCLVWMQREKTSQNSREELLNKTDIATGLLSEQEVLARLPHVILRADRFSQPCAVIMMRWLDFQEISSTELNASTRNRILAHLGIRIGRIARDIDSVARIGDDHFLFVVEAPASETLVNEITSKLLASCLRPSTYMPGQKGFDLQLAVWLSNKVAADASQVLEMLKTRLNQMSTGTQRRVQFIDAPLSSNPKSGSTLPGRPSSQELLDKINKLEQTQVLPTIAYQKFTPMKATLDADHIDASRNKVSGQRTNSQGNK